MSRLDDQKLMHRFEKLILASRSPRRADILRSVGWPFEIVVADIDETRYDGEAPMDYVRRLSLAKATVVASKIEEGLVLGADTTVAIDDHILEKPTDDDDARRMNVEIILSQWQCEPTCADSEFENFTALCQSR